MSKSLARLTEEKKIQITIIRHEREAITTYPTDVERVIKEYCEQCYAHTLDNLDELDQYLKGHNVTKLI